MVRKWTNRSDLRIGEKHLRHFFQTDCGEDYPLLQEEQQIARRRLCPAIVPCSGILLRHRENTARQIMELRPHGVRRSLRNGDDQLRRKICRRRRRKGGLRRLSQIFPRLRQRKDKAERAHDFSVRRSMKSVCPIFAATWRAFSRSPISCRRSAILRSVTSQPGSSSSAAVRSSRAPA